MLNGAHKSSLVKTEKYLLTCYLYIELNTVRAGMVLS
jgi:putative transposase